MPNTRCTSRMPFSSRNQTINLPKWTSRVKRITQYDEDSCYFQVTTCFIATAFFAQNGIAFATFLLVSKSPMPIIIFIIKDIDLTQRPRYIETGYLIEAPGGYTM